MFALIAALISFFTTIVFAVIGIFFEPTTDRLIAVGVAYGFAFTLMCVQLSYKTNVTVERLMYPSQQFVCKFEKCEGGNSQPVACVMSDRMTIPTR